MNAVKTKKEAANEAANRIRIKRLIKGNLYPDTIGTKKGGNILCRWGYFYSHGKTSIQYVEKVTKLLDQHHIQHRIVNNGDHWVAFRGGASTANQSHFYVEIKII